MTIALAVAVVFVLASATPSSSQVPLALPSEQETKDDQTGRRPGTVDIPLMERSRFLRNVPNADTGEHYEGFIAAHFPLGGSMQTSYDKAGLGSAALAFLGSFSMMSNVRQLDEESAPVRSPSYMPRLRITAVRTGSIPFIVDRATRQWVADFTVGHYSNGQSGCLYEQQMGPECQLPDGIPDDDLRVRRGGSFSSHYLELGVARRWLWWDDSYLGGTTRRGAKHVLAVFGRSRDYRALSGVGGGMDRDLGRLYGWRRQRVGLEYAREASPANFFAGQSWLQGWVEHSRGTARAVSGLRVSVEAGHSFDRVGGTGLFVRYYNGHDDYNAAFTTPLNVVQVGLSLGGERRPTYAGGS